ncbi:hypothetical protein BDV96DRAFT_168462 [Lophiotrema nucula]|uniref:Uncharacterized protein n=1 Tax=Lophiotrema nucula TaxID=690887 RepID=A0A6A5Z107_9PLEO|nr:hypothetical protein BDV96DRAFT_168462 [Lophiotrema nucula]
MDRNETINCWPTHRLAVRREQFHEGTWLIAGLASWSVLAALTPHRVSQDMGVDELTSGVFDGAPFGFTRRYLCCFGKSRARQCSKQRFHHGSVADRAATVSLPMAEPRRALGRPSAHVCKRSLARNHRRRSGTENDAKAQQPFQLSAFLQCALRHHATGSSKIHEASEPVLPQTRHEAVANQLLGLAEADIPRHYRIRPLAKP